MKDGAGTITLLQTRVWLADLLGFSTGVFFVPVAGKIGIIPLILGRKRFDFRFPESGNARDHMMAIFGGREYPLLEIPDFVPHNIVDIGANVGATVVYFASNYPDASVFCYEPSPANFDFLVKNVAGFSNVFPFNYGLFDRDLKVPLYQGSSQCLQHSIYRSVETGNGYEVAELRPASNELIARDITPSILKIDTEGCELPILKDIADCLPRVDVIYIEYHSERDRLAIDRLLEQHFSLAHANATLIHRGSNVYISNRLLELHPWLGEWEISPEKQ
jgi:FkbM family methyltransferase